MYLIPQLKGEEKIKYLRKSRADDPLLAVEEVLSKHEQMLDEWVEKNQPDGGPIPEENTFREVVSGETLDSRPQMLELLRRIESPKIKAIVCVEPQRLSRGDYEDIGRLVKLLRYTNTLVITLQYTYDLNDDRDRDFFERELKRGNELLEYQKRIMNNGILLAVQNGNFIGQRAPYGYKKVAYREKGRVTRTLEPIPERAEAVRAVFEMYRDGYGTFKISEKLDEMKYPPPEGKRWVRETVVKMLTNVHYIGKVTWQRNKTVHKVIDGEVHKKRPTAEKYLIYEGKHPAILDQELWDAVQEKLGKNPRNKKETELFNPLAGLLFCSRCGRTMRAQKFQNTRSDGGPKCAPRYTCSYSKRCGNGSATMDEVLKEVDKILVDAIHDFEVRIESGADDSAEAHRRHIERLEKKLEDLRALEKKQWDEKIKGQMPIHVFEALNSETVAEIEEVDHALWEIKNTVAKPIEIKEKVVTFRAALDTLRNQDASPTDKNELLKQCIEGIEYERKPKQGHPRWGVSEPLEMKVTLRV